MIEKKYGFDYVSPNWRLFDLESGMVIVRDTDGEAFWARVKGFYGITFSEIQGYGFD